MDIHQFPDCLLCSMTFVLLTTRLSQCWELYHYAPASHSFLVRSDFIFSKLPKLTEPRGKQRRDNTFSLSSYIHIRCIDTYMRAWHPFTRLSAQTGQFLVHIWRAHNIHANSKLYLGNPLKLCLTSHKYSNVSNPHQVRRMTF